MLNLDKNALGEKETLEIQKNELESVVIDLLSLSDMLNVIEESDHYNDMVCRSLKNNIEYIKDKLIMIIDSAS